MFRAQTLLVVTMLMISAPAFAGDTPDPSSKGEAALPSGSNTGAPQGDAPADKVPDVAEGKAGDNPSATSPGEENKGKPIVPAQ